MYDDEYATCERTFATLHISHDDLDPEAVTRDLGIEPSRGLKKGEVRNPGGRRPVYARVGSWSLTSEDKVSSRDVRRHIDWLLDQVESRSAVLTQLQALGCETEISCFWSSAAGHGSPTVSPGQSARLADLGLDLEFDLYF